MVRAQSEKSQPHGDGRFMGAREGRRYYWLVPSASGSDHPLAWSEERCFQPFQKYAKQNSEIYFQSTKLVYFRRIILINQEWMATLRCYFVCGRGYIYWYTFSFKTAEYFQGK
jgi:hypothetical protein